MDRLLLEIINKKNWNALRGKHVYFPRVTVPKFSLVLGSDKKERFHQNVSFFTSNNFFFFLIVRIIPQEGDSNAPEQYSVYYFGKPQRNGLQWLLLMDNN